MLKYGLVPLSLVVTVVLMYTGHWRDDWQFFWWAFLAHDIVMLSANRIKPLPKYLLSNLAVDILAIMLCLWMD